MMAEFNSTPFENGLQDFGPEQPGTGSFDFTPLFEFSILSIAPSALFLLILPFRLRSLGKQSRKVKRSLMDGNKLVLLALFTIFQAAILILYAANPKVRTPTSIAAATLTLIGAIGLCFLSHSEHTHSIRPSTIINTYLFITLLVDITHTRTLYIQDAPKHITAVFTAVVVIKLVVAILEAVGKRSILLDGFQDANLETTSGIYSRALFWWLNGLMGIGFRRIIQREDLFTIEDSMKSSLLGSHAQKKWNERNKSRQNALFCSTLSSTRLQLIQCIFPRLCLIGFRYAQPLLLSRTADFVRNKEDGKNIGWGLTGAFGVVFIGTAVANGVYMHLTMRFITSVRGGLVGMIFGKTVKLSINALDESAALTLMSNDTEAICGTFQNLHELWAVPVEFGIAMYLLRRELGISFLAPAVIAIISTGCIIAISKHVGKSQTIWNQGIQTRVDVTSTMLGSMKAIKILGFTPKVEDILQGLRVKELRLSNYYRRLLCASVFFTNNMRIYAPFLTFLVFVLLQSHTQVKLTASTAFTALALIGLLSNPVNTLLRTIPAIKAALACFERIQRFLEASERRAHVLPLNGSEDLKDGSVVQELDVEVLPSRSSGDEDIELGTLTPRHQDQTSKTLPIIKVQEASLSWNINGHSVINKITFSVSPTDFVFIIGPVGCGKSTLLKGLLGETPSTQGLVHMAVKEISFVDQTPWIQNMSIKDNIVGPGILDTEWYEEVVRACELEVDVRVLPDCHDTIVGSKGISLSGGQKQRVALARALYAKNRLVIIDDGFSGLDATTEEVVFKNLFGRQGLLKRFNITVILVTNAVHRLPYADHIISLNAQGQIGEQGTFQQLQKAGGYVEAVATSYKPESTSATTGLTKDASPQIKPTTAPQDKKTQEALEDLTCPIGEWSTYSYYFLSIGLSRSLLSLLYLTLSGVSIKLTELLVTYWTTAISSQGNSVNGKFLGYYGLLAGLGTVFWSVACYHYFLYVVPGSAEELHERLLRSVMSATLGFFASTDMGVTTNRFSQDMSVVDKELPFALIDLIVALVQTVMGAALMCFATGYFAFTLPPVFAIVWVIQKFYLRTSRQIRLLDLEAKSPLYSHFISTLSGLPTIRSFNWSTHFINLNHTYLDASQKPYYLLFCIQRWLSIVLDLMVALLAVILMILIVELRDEMKDENVALAMLNIINFNQSLTWIIKQWTSLETSIGAVSRLKNFTSSTPSENLPAETQSVPNNWPTDGVITFKNLSASYSISTDCPLVLKDINLSIKPGEKVLICGRTGSGKSSLLLTLFRLLEISPQSSIIIDGIDITTIPRQLIRSRLISIPQDPFFLPNSSIRENLTISPSPSSTTPPDSILISSLQKVHLWSHIQTKGGLNSPLSLDNEIFSQGQKQLFSLARAIVRSSNQDREPKIVVLDEMSSSVDIETEKLMMSVIGEAFEGCTVIGVAHRRGAMDGFERVVVMGDGRVLEDGERRVLLRREGGVFRRLWGELGG